MYACPVGPLGEQVESYLAESLRRCGPNSAHGYMPHCSLTGFFYDDPASIPGYVDALGSALARARPHRPDRPVRVVELRLGPDFLGLLLESPWLRVVAAEFVKRATSSTRRAPLRLKSDLHVSLAYGFRDEDSETLTHLARTSVNPEAPGEWRLRLYEQKADRSWECHIDYPV